MRQPLLLTFVLIVTGSMHAACGSSSAPQPAARQFVVSLAPLDVGFGTGLCVAVEPANPRGIWWWMPGPSDCSSRSSGPTVTHADAVTVSRSADGRVVDVRFQIALIRAPDSPGPPVADVALTLEGDHMRAVASGAEVATALRADLDIPEAWR